MKVGRTYDLESLFDRLNRIYFDSKLNVIVRWSPRSTPKARRRVVLGTFEQKMNTITLSRRLDNPRVPLFFLEHVLFHEMLHAIFPRDDHRMHTDQFKKFERMHPDYALAREWEKSSIKILFEKAQGELNMGKRLA